MGIEDGFVLEQAVVALTAPGGRVVVVVGVGVVVGAVVVAGEALVVVAVDLAVEVVVGVAVEVDVDPVASKADVRCAGWLTPSPERAVVAGDDVVPGEAFAGGTVVEDADLGVVVVVEVDLPGAT